MFDSSLVQYELGMYARRICSGIFLCGRELAEILQHSGPPAKILDALSIFVDTEARRVSVTYEGVTRTAQFVDDQGSVVLPKDDGRISFTPVKVTSRLPPADQQEWPMGDVLTKNVSSSALDRNQIQEAIDVAFQDPRNLTAAVVVVHRGEIVGERYLKGITKDTQLESWSMGKSLLATVFARLVLDGTYALDHPAPVPEWQSPGDRRKEIRIRDLLQMSSGLQFSSSFDPNYRVMPGLSDHSRAYIEAIDIHQFSRSKPLEIPAPRWKGRYRNGDPWVLGSLIKDALLTRGEEYLSYPQRELFDRIGIRKQVVETDPFGNLIFTGCDYGTARNWARLGLLYLQKGVWNNERLLPESWTDFVSSPAPAWEHGEYGGLFWIATSGLLPPGSYYAAGAGGQYTYIVPKHDLVVVRMGHYPELTGIPHLATEPDVSVGHGVSTMSMLAKLIAAMPRA